jgi:hypothetical protein
MKSPFPGMDPYLEPHWPDVHTKLVAYAADSLNASLPEELVARTEERIAIETGRDEPECIVPDISVLETVELSHDAAPAGDVATAPYRLVVSVEPVTERFIQIIDASLNRVVTVIEFVSPSNKRGKGLEAFQDKRAELLSGGVNFVEIDLVRSGDWRALLQPHVCPRKATAVLRAAIRLSNDRRAVYMYPISLRGRLPVLPVPLRVADPKVELDLQILLDSVYRNGRYGATIDYSQDCEPPLGAEDAAWAAELLKAAGHR